MPSKTFYNLDKEKQDKLIDCAMKEFASKSYPDVSINQIIANANIPRGSFYMYFENKDDLFSYLLEISTKKLNQQIKKIVIKNNGDLRKSFIELYFITSERIHNKNLTGIYKNLFIFFSLTKKHPPHPGHKLYEEIKDKINTKNIKEADLEFIFSMFMHTLLTTIEELTKNNDHEKVKKQYFQKIDIICYGIYKEEY